MSEVLKVVAKLDRREVQATAAEAGAQMAPQPRFYLTAASLVLLLALYLGPFVSFPLVQLLPMESWKWAAPALAILVPLVAIIFGMIWVNKWHNRRAWAAYDRAWEERGIPAELQATYTIEDAGLRMENTRGEYLLFWPSISDLFRVKNGWAVNSDISIYYIPSDAFDTVAHEHQFVVALLERMNEPARERSAAVREATTLA